MSSSVHAAANGEFEDNGPMVDGEAGLAMATEVHSAFHAFLRDPEFPCLGAKSIVNQGSYRFRLYRDLADADSTKALAADLYRFIEERDRLGGDFTSFVACFLEPKVHTGREFEQLLWQELQALHEIDAAHFRWSNGVSSRPEAPNFSFSFGSEPFFIVGLSPSSRRWARRFPWPALVFNDHEQFERLRREQRFDRLKGAIRERDEKLHGSANDMLGDFGVHSEARQYAGRRVGSNWKCPVHFGTDGGQG